MARLWVAVVVCASAGLCAALADNYISVWEQTGSCTVNQFLFTVDITSAGRFKIVATSDDPSGLGYIQYVKIASNVQGTVELYIAPDPNDPNMQGLENGAKDVGFVGFELEDPASPPAGIAVDLKELRVLKRLGYLTEFPTCVTTISGAFRAEDVLRDLHVYEDLTGPLDVAYLDDASLYLWDPNATHSGSIRVTSVGPGQEIDVLGNMAGDIQIGVEGTCTSCRLDGLLHVAGTANNVKIYTCEHPMAGQIQLGSLQGILPITSNVARGVGGKSIEIGTLGGQVRLYRSLVNNTFVPAEIAIESLVSGGAVAIDWDADDPDNSDYWRPGAAISVRDSNDPNVVHYYYENHPPEPNDPNPLYDITCKKGDLDNNGDCDFDDVNPFILALSDPDGYEAAFPGLGGSMLYHGDCSCDDAFDYDDIEPFVDCLGGWNPACETCTGDSLGGQPPARDAQTVAGVFHTYLSEELYSTFVGLVEQIVDAHGDTPRGQFWADVLDYFQGD